MSTTTVTSRTFPSLAKDPHVSADTPPPQPRASTDLLLSVDLPALDVSHIWDRTPCGLCECLSLTVNVRGPSVLCVSMCLLFSADISPWTHHSLSICQQMDQ